MKRCDHVPYWLDLDDLRYPLNIAVLPDAEAAARAKQLPKAGALSSYRRCARKCESWFGANTYRATNAI
jgi:hypothetical protein